MRTGRLVVGDRTLEHDVSGPCAGLGFVFLHGLASARAGEKSRGFEAAFGARGLGFARVDTTGHGGSTGELRTLTLTRQVEDATAHLEHLRDACGWTRPPVLIGSSLGGLTAAWLSARRPDLVAAQVLLAPGLRLIENLIARLGPERRDRWERTGGIVLDSPWVTIPMAFDLARDWSRHPHDALPSLTRRPTLILHGTDDEVVPVDDSRSFARRCDPALVELVEIEGGDHRLTAHLDLIVERALGFCARRLGAP